MINTTNCYYLAKSLLVLEGLVLAKIRLNEHRQKPIYGSLNCEMSTFLHPSIKLIPKYLSYEDFRQNDGQLARFWPSVKTIYLPTSTSQLTKNQIAEVTALIFIDFLI